LNGIRSVRMSKFYLWEEFESFVGLRKHLKPTNDSGRMDETYLKIKGKNAYLYRAVDSAGNTIGFFVSENRDKAVNYIL